MRWNSWFIILNVALKEKVKNALMVYVEYFKDKLLKEDKLINADWIQLRTTSKFLYSFYNATLYLEEERTTLERVLKTFDML